MRKFSLHDAVDLGYLVRRRESAERTIVGYDPGALGSMRSHGDASSFDSFSVGNGCGIVTLEATNGPSLNSYSLASNYNHVVQQSVVRASQTNNAYAPALAREFASKTSELDGANLANAIRIVKRWSDFAAESTSTFYFDDSIASSVAYYVAATSEKTFAADTDVRDRAWFLSWSQSALTSLFFHGDVDALLETLQEAKALRRHHKKRLLPLQQCRRVIDQIARLAHSIVRHAPPRVVAGSFG